MKSVETAYWEGVAMQKTEELEHSEHLVSTTAALNMKLMQENEKLEEVLKMADNAFTETFDLMQGHLLDSQHFQAKVKELEGLLKMHVPNVELILKMLTESPWPTGDLRWQFIEEWCKQFIRLHATKEATVLVRGENVPLSDFDPQEDV